MKKIDITNHKYGRLTAISEVFGKRRTTWLCQCECGAFKEVVLSKLRGGQTKSCGCLNKEKRLIKAKQMNSVWTKYSPKEATSRRVWKKRYSDGDILYENFIELTSKNCFYCGEAPKNKQGDFIYNGLDRIDNNIGHYINNVVPCCKYCNYSKRDLTINDFFTNLFRLYFNYGIK